jgi:diadenosine tetraphosphatase ApaH/serine/threonine PP2A family protein phosphatase
VAGRTIVIGDIHGCYDELSELLERIGMGAEDRVVSVGDLVVKGEKNREVLDLFIGDPRFAAVVGNHDRALLRYWRGEKRRLKREQLKASEQLGGGRGGYLEYLASLQPVLDLGSHIVLHAGLRPGVPLEEQSIKDLTELRTLGRRRRASKKGTPWYEVYDGEKIVLFGHWPSRSPRRGPRAVGLDTGCVYGGRLTAYVVETGEFVSVAARRAYCPRGRDAGPLERSLRRLRKVARKLQKRVRAKD